MRHHQSTPAISRGRRNDWGWLRLGTYRAVVTNCQVAPGDRVGIIGLGGLGQVGARIAALKGAEVHAAEPKQDLWPMAKELGVTEVATDITAFSDLDVVVDFAGFGTTTAGAIEAVRDFGRVVQVGMGFAWRQPSPPTA